MNGSSDNSPGPEANAGGDLKAAPGPPEEHPSEEHSSAEETFEGKPADRETTGRDQQQQADEPVILTVIANWFMGDRVLAFAAMHDADLSFINPGRGTVRKAIQREIGLSDLRKEIVTILTGRRQACDILEDLKNEMNLEGEHTGIAFLRNAVVYESRDGQTREVERMKRDEGETMRAIYVLVRKGFAENVILAGERAGTRGATVISGRGEAREGKIPGLLIGEEKELILIITSQEKTRSFLEVIRNDAAIRHEGEGKAFVMEVIDSVGINFF